MKQENIDVIIKDEKVIKSMGKVVEYLMRIAAQKKQDAKSQN